jgi:hypothetical protein
MKTDRIITSNDNEKETCALIDVAITGDRNAIKKETKKVLKYKDFTTKTQRSWIVATKVTPVIKGTNGTI